METKFLILAAAYIPALLGLGYIVIKELDNTIEDIKKLRE